MGEVFYTKERKEELTKLQKDPAVRQRPLNMMLGLAMLDAMGEMQNTLKMISDTLSEGGRATTDNEVQCGMRVKRGDIYYADLGEREGSEQSGVRPVAIVQNDTGNAYSPTVVVVPATTKNKRALSTHVPVKKEDGLDGRTIFLAEQVLTVDKSRLRDFAGTLCEHTMKEIGKALKVSLGIKNE